MTAGSSREMALLSHHDLGFGNCGEGMAIQLTRGGRRVLWLANDVFVDERGVVYTVDRLTGGLYVLELAL